MVLSWCVLMINLVSFLSHTWVKHNIVDIMIEESYYYSDVMKKYFNKKLLMDKKDVEGLEN